MTRWYAWQIRAILAVVILVAGTSTSWAAKKRTRKHTPFNRDAMIAKLLILHNKQRAAKGEDPLVINPKLMESAQEYAEYLAKIGKLSHTAEGTPGSRAKEAGYRYHAIGENIADGQTSPGSVVKAWMHSTGHRKNILSSHFKEVGFGIAKDKRGKIYWVVDFGHK